MRETYWPVVSFTSRAGYRSASQFLQHARCPLIALFGQFVPTSMSHFGSLLIVHGPLKLCKLAILKNRNQRAVYRAV